jgi:peptidyl-tRNA hydrolase, PTH1 family
MNLSGKAVQFWMEKAAIPLENVLVITDDLNLPFGTIRIKPKGSDGGHNGLKHINLVLNTQTYTRFRFGISDEFKKGKQVDYVLGEWNEEEKTNLTERLELASEIIKSFGTAGLENTMTAFNGK